MNNKSGSEPSHKYRDFMKLTLEERRRLMSESSEKYVAFEQAEKCYDSFPEFPFLNQVNRAECVEKIADAIQRSKAMLESAVVGAIQMIEGYDKSYDDLQKLCEEQKMFLESCVQFFEEGRSPIGTPWFKGLKKMTNKNQDAPQMAEPFDRSWYGMWRAAMTTIEEQKGEIERLKALGLGGTIQDILQKSERMYSQLATQTERVGVLEEALDECRAYFELMKSLGKLTDGGQKILDKAKQAINQDSLGDWK